MLYCFYLRKSVSIINKIIVIVIVLCVTHFDMNGVSEGVDCGVVGDVDCRTINLPAVRPDCLLQQRFHGQVQTKNMDGVDPGTAWKIKPSVRQLYRVRHIG